MTKGYMAVPDDEAAVIKATRTQGRRGVTATYAATEDAMNEPGTMFFVPHVQAVEFGNAYRRVRQNGMLLHTSKGEREGVAGVFVWAEFIEG